MLEIKLNRAKEIFANVNKQQIAVIGDVMLDRYFWGDVSRISPEAPVPVVDVQDETYHLGGAANVANNLCSLGVTPVLCGLLGEDEAAELFLTKCQKTGILPAGLFKDVARVTTVKTRIIGNNQQIVRLDKEVRAEISPAGEKFIMSQINHLDNLQGIIFEDYDKGTINPQLIEKIITFARERKIPIFVDPKFDNFMFYKDVTLFKPNKKETEKGLRMKLSSQEKTLAAGRKMQKMLNAENILLTLGAAGMVLFDSAGEFFSVPTIARKVADVSGAGDTAIATYAATSVAGATCKEAALLANFASGIACEKPGITAVEKEEIFLSIERNLPKKQ